VSSPRILYANVLTFAECDSFQGQLRRCDPEHYVTAAAGTRDARVRSIATLCLFGLAAVVALNYESRVTYGIVAPSKACRVPDMKCRRQERDAGSDARIQRHSRADERSQVTRERAGKQRIQSRHDA
jgi:hypothetical protein